MCAGAYLTYGSTCIYCHTFIQLCLHNCTFKMLGNPDLVCLFFTVHTNEVYITLFKGGNVNVASCC